MSCTAEQLQALHEDVIMLLCVTCCPGMFDRLPAVFCESSSGKITACFLHAVLCHVSQHTCTQSTGPSPSRARPSCSCTQPRCAAERYSRSIAFADRQQRDFLFVLSTRPKHLHPLRHVCRRRKVRTRHFTAVGLQDTSVNGVFCTGIL